MKPHPERQRALQLENVRNQGVLDVHYYSHPRLRRLGRGIETTLMAGIPLISINSYNFIPEGSSLRPPVLVVAAVSTVALLIWSRLRRGLIV